jgi:rSAM/selenodomain-associated transferase 1
MVEDTWRKATELVGVEAILFVDELWEGFVELSQGRPIRLQSQGSLGARMYSCFQMLRKDNFKSIIIMGTDSPTVPESHLRTAFSLLGADDDAVIGPTEDGGYYLVGCGAPQPNMFSGVPWSSTETFARTLDAFESEGYRTRRAPPWWDVDSPDDLDRLIGSDLGPSVRKWVEGQGSPPSVQGD